MNAWVIPGLKVQNGKKIDLMIRDICNYYGIDEDELVRKTRLRNVVAAKKAICYNLMTNFHMSDTKVAVKYKLKLHRCTVRHHNVDFGNKLEVKDREATELQKRIQYYLL